MSDYKFRQQHHAYVFANRRGNRLKVLVHDGIGLWLCARRLHQGRFSWVSAGPDTRVSITHEQLAALVIGLPWQRIGENATIRVSHCLKPNVTCRDRCLT